MDPMAAADISQNMTAAMPKNVKAGGMMLALLMTVVTFTAADCPDAGIRCRIPASDADTTVSTAACPLACSVRVLPKAAVCQPPLRIKGSSSGCSGGGSASGGATGDVPTGMININGMYYNSETDSDQTTFAVIGDITGQCYNAIEGKSNRSFAPFTWPDSKLVCNTCYGHTRTHATKKIAKSLRYQSKG